MDTALHMMARSRPLNIPEKQGAVCGTELAKLRGMRSVLTGCLGAVVIAAVLTFAGCVVSPIPEPPQASLDIAKVFGDSSGMRGITINGDPGAAEPVGATVRVYNLDSSDDPVDGVVEVNGSFIVELLVNEGDEVRLQIIDDEVRSDPIDAIFGRSGTRPVPSERPLASCLILDPPAELALGASQAVVVENRCDEEVQIEEPTLRRPLTGIAIGADRSWPEVLPQGGSVSVTVAVDAGWSEEDIFFIEASGPEHDRRPITVIAPP